MTSLEKTRLYTLLTILLTTAAMSPAAASTDLAPCPDIVPVDGGQPRLHELADSPSADIVGLRVAAPGWLALEVEAVYPRTAGAWWEPWRTACDAAWSIAEQHLDSGWIYVRQAGLVHLRLGRLDSAGPRPGKLVRLVTYFFADQNPPAWPELALGERPKDGESGDNTESDEDEILPTNPSGCGPDGVAESAADACLCAAEPANDLKRCATFTSLGETLQAALESPSGEDRDYYFFDVERAAVVRIGSRGSVDTFAVLYDSRGRELAAADDGGEGENFALRVHLAAGRYVLRVEGVAGSEGAYALSVE